MHFSFNRRSFLKASLFTTLACLLGADKAWANLPEEGFAPGRLHLYNIHTGEKARVTFRGWDGQYDQEAIDRINWLLRCHYTNEEHPIDPVTLEYLNQVDQLLGGSNEIHVISGYRSPNYNNQLIQRGHKVAKNSLHLQGRALDIRIPGTELTTLHQAALSLRLGGVGFYPGDNFVHIDSGAFRTW
ncbi:MAG: YcbK family protein [Thermodesulfobacteriota bacterium]